ncbi:MAG TPA: ABC transporter ATP-binding protein, partial [Anaerolineae bacterium]
MSQREFTLPNEYHYNRQTPGSWIVSHVIRYPWWPVLILLAAILNNLFFSYIQVTIGRGFDLISSAGWSNAALGGLALTLLGVAFGQAVTGLVRNSSAELTAQAVERDARDELYASLLGKSQTFHGRQRIGDIMARATNDVHMLNLMFSPGLNLIVDSMLAIVLPVILIARLRFQLLLVPAIFLVALALTIWDYNRRLNPVSNALRDQFGTMNAGLAEAVSGIEIVKANVQERGEWYKFASAARLYRDYFVRQGQIQALYWPQLMFSLAWAGAFLHGILTWRAGSITLGQTVAYIGLFGTLRYPTFISLFTFNLVQIGAAGARRILAVINTETDLDENVNGYAAPIAGEVAFEHVSFGYDGKCVLDDISFTIRRGQTVAIVGQTGSGKTTLTRLINRIFDTDGGRVLVDGVDVRNWSLESLRSQISVIEQDIFLFSRTIAENIAFGQHDATPEQI